MPHKPVVPSADQLHPTTGPYTHALEVAPSARWLYVSGLARPEFLVEVDLVAAKAA